MSTTQRLNAGRKTSPRASGRRARRLKGAVPDQDGRERILSAAIRAFAEVGYAGATTAGIARDAGVTQPLVHHHFGSKDGLWRAAVDAVFSNIPRLIPNRDGGPSGETLTEIIGGFVRFVA